MDKYSHFKSKDFVWDESFRNWVLHPTPELDAYWAQWLLDHPLQSPVIQQAKEVVLLLKVKDPLVSDSEVELLVRKTAGRREQRTEQQSTPIVSIQRWYQQSWIKMAASVLLVIGLGWAFYTQSDSRAKAATYEQLISIVKEPLIEKVNATQLPLLVRLPDGSTVRLQKGSRISYSPAFNGAKREVYLTGEGFFDVVKNPSQPFLVYANELVTKVLGTSFTVKAYESDQQITVDVRTGKVSVFASADSYMKERATHRELEGVVLTPNQRIVFSREAVRMTKSLVEQPVVTVLSKEPINFSFEDAPVSEVFHALEEAYSVDILYDEELMRHCPLTASFTNESLFEKLNIICKAVEADYQEIDGQIVVYSQGCK